MTHRLRCPECQHAIAGLDRYGHCPKCLYPLSAHYLALRDGDDWVRSPGEQEQFGSIVADTGLVLIYQLAWDQA